MANRTFTVVFQSIPPEEGVGYYAHVPALGITTDGETLEEAKEMAQDAIEGFIEGLQAVGKAIPTESRTERLEVSL